MLVAVLASGSEADAAQILAPILAVGAPGLASEDPLTGQCLDWIAEFTEALRPYTNGAYVNVPNAATANWENDYWGPNVEPLRGIKAKYDPDNVFNFEQSIPPETQPAQTSRRASFPQSRSSSRSLH